MSKLYSIGAVSQLADSLDRAGYTPEDLTKLKQAGDLLVDIRKFLNGDYRLNQEIDKLNQKCLKIDQVIAKHDKNCCDDIDQVFESFDKPTDDSLINESLKNDIERVLQTLSERGAKFIRLYFGINCQKCLDFNSLGKYEVCDDKIEFIAQSYNLEKNEVSRIIRKSIRRLKLAYRSNLLREYLG